MEGLTVEIDNGLEGEKVWLGKILSMLLVAAHPTDKPYILRTTCGTRSI